MNSVPKERARRASTQAGSIFTREPILLLGLLVAVFYFGRPLLLPMALALTFAFLLTPLVRRLERLRVGRTSAALLVLFGATALIGVVFWVVAGQLLTVVNELPSHSANIRAKLAKTHVPPSSSLGQAVVSLEGLSHEFSTDSSGKEASRTALSRRARRAAERAQAAAGTAAPTPVVVVPTTASGAGYLRQIARPVLEPLGTAGMVLIFSVYMLLKRENLRNRLLLLAGIGRLNLVSNALDDAGDRISRFLIANVSVNAGFGCVFGAALYAIGVPYAVLWGALLALLRTIPFVGSFVGAALPTLFALIYFSSWWQAGFIIALIGLLEILVSNFLEPWLYGAHTGISELALLAMAVVWSLLWGWPGLALSTPLTVCLIVVGRTMPQMSFLHILLGDDAELAPDARFYERMLALDQAEARLIAERFLNERSVLKRRSVLELYDSILLPALALAESDRHKGQLEGNRAAYFMQSVAELVEEMASYSMRVPATGASALPLTGAADRRFAEQKVERRCCPVVCIAAGDQADEIAATMLAQVLEAQGHKTVLVSADSLTAELLRRVGESPQTVICISALPPFAFKGARALYQSVRIALPENPIFVGLWRSRTDPNLLRDRFGLLAESDRVVTRLAEAVKGFEDLEPSEILAAAASVFSRSS